MRELKYKVWDTKEKRWLKQHEFVLGMLDDNLVVYKAYCEQQGGTEEYESSVDFEDDITEKVKVVEYTGKKDLKGKDIYDGDLAIHKIGSEVFPYLVEIEWIDDRGSWGYHAGGMFGIFEDIFCSEIPQSLEVVSNIYTKENVREEILDFNKHKVYIYENPELLKPEV